MYIIYLFYQSTSFVNPFCVFEVLLSAKPFISFCFFFYIYSIHSENRKLLIDLFHLNRIDFFQIHSNDIDEHIDKIILTE